MYWKVELGVMTQPFSEDEDEDLENNNNNKNDEKELPFGNGGQPDPQTYGEKALTAHFLMERISGREGDRLQMESMSVAQLKDMATRKCPQAVADFDTASSKKKKLEKLLGHWDRETETQRALLKTLQEEVQAAIKEQQQINRMGMGDDAPGGSGGIPSGKKVSSRRGPGRMKTPPKKKEIQDGLDVPGQGVLAPELLAFMTGMKESMAGINKRLDEVQGLGGGTGSGTSRSSKTTTGAPGTQKKKAPGVSGDIEKKQDTTPTNKEELVKKLAKAMEGKKAPKKGKGATGKKSQVSSAILRGSCVPCVNF